MEVSLLELNAVKAGFGTELKAAFPDAPDDASLLEHSSTPTASCLRCLE